MAQTTTEQTTISRPYAEAAFKRAKETDSLELWSEMLRNLTTIVKDPLMMGLIANPKVQREQLQVLILEIAGEALSAEGHNFLRVLVENDRVQLLPEIAQLYQELKAQDQGTIEAKVYSAYSVNATQKRKIASALKERLGKEVSLSTEKDPSLLGGIVIRAGDFVIDGSVRGRLQRMAASLKS